MNIDPVPNLVHQVSFEGGDKNHKGRSVGGAI